ncbi:hypothetical protein [Cellulomonas soli]
MNAPSDDRPARPATAGLGRELARGLADGLVEIAVWAAAVIVVVGGLGLVGRLVAGTPGMLVGALVGALALGIAWVVLVVAGVSLLAGRVRRRG